jgi:hypothetical protein
MVSLPTEESLAILNVLLNSLAVTKSCEDTEQLKAMKRAKISDVFTSIFFINVNLIINHTKRLF